MLPSDSVNEEMIYTVCQIKFQPLRKHFQARSITRIGISSRCSKCTRKNWGWCKKTKKLKLKGLIWSVEKDYLYLRCAKLEVVLSRQKTYFQLIDRLNDLSVLLFPCCFWHNGIFHRPSWNEKFLVNGQVLSLPHPGWACANVPTNKKLSKTFQKSIDPIKVQILQNQDEIG